MATMRNDGWYEGAEQLRITTGEFEDRDPSVPVEAVCYHISDGWDSRNHGQNVQNNSSFHFLIRMEAGRAKVYQFISIFNTAYANGRHSGVTNPHMPQWIKNLINRGKNPNQATISIEHEGDYPTGLPFPDPIIKATIDLVKWICSKVPTVIKDRAHQIGHYQIDHIDRAFCPGGPGGAQFPFDLIVSAILTPPPTPSKNPDPSGFFEVTGFKIIGGIGEYWRANGGVAVFGYPLANEESGSSHPWSKVPELSGFTIQCFEYQTLGWKSGVGVVRVRSGAVIKALR